MENKIYSTVNSANFCITTNLYCGFLLTELFVIFLEFGIFSRIILLSYKIQFYSILPKVRIL